jgi:hypothetical protein
MGRHQDPRLTTEARRSRGSPRPALLIAGLLAVAALVGGILLIDDGTAQTIYLLLLVAAMLGWDASVSRGGAGRPGGARSGEAEQAFPWIPLALAVLVVGFFESDDAVLAAVIPLGLAFVALWKLAARRRRGAAA